MSAPRRTVAPWTIAPCPSVTSSSRIVGCVPLRHVDRAVVLDVRARADADEVAVAADDRVVPDRHVVAEDDVADHGGGLGEVDALSERRALSRVFLEDAHESGQFSTESARTAGGHGNAPSRSTRGGSTVASTSVDGRPPGVRPPSTSTSISPGMSARRLVRVRARRLARTVQARARHGPDPREQRAQGVVRRQAHGERRARRARRGSAPASGRTTVSGAGQIAKKRSSTSGRRGDAERRELPPRAEEHEQRLAPRPGA